MRLGLFCHIRYKFSHEKNYKKLTKIDRIKYRHPFRTKYAQIDSSTP